MKKFDELIATKDKFSVKAKMFYLAYYLRKGYNVGPECTVTFIKDENIEGVLKTKNGDLTIYHKGIIETESSDTCFQGEIMHVRKCDIEFPLKKNPETEKIPHLKFLLQDIVFEDWVHKGFGFMIKIDDILKYDETCRQRMGDRKIEKMKEVLDEHTGGDMCFVECYNCEDMAICFKPGGSFTTNSWEYCRMCTNKFWCGKCDAGWNSKETECRSCFQSHIKENKDDEEEDEEDEESQE